MALLSCDGHWSALKEGLARHGVAHLISPTGAEAVDRWGAYNRALQLANVSLQAQTFDALMCAWWSVVAEFTRQAGHAALRDQDRYWCPLCLVRENGEPELVSQWVEHACGEAAERASALGLRAVS